ncbi:MAG: metal-dependent hydrolase [Anaerolineaceae bacterium]|nr:metal-dependent hydrolase [Anaerolineaceae bacterium]
MTTTITWYGHATFGLQIDEYFMLIDPFFAHNPLASVSADSFNPQYILVTHGHGDHVGDTIDIAKRSGATVISNAEICGWLQKQDVKTHAQHIGGGFTHPFGYVKLTQALHGSALPDGSNGGNPAGFLITTLHGKKLYFAGDTGLFGDMQLIGDEGLDYAAIPIGDNYTMGPADALRAAKFLRAKHLQPIHFNTFDLLKQDANAWAKQVEKDTDSKVHILKPGETFTI